MVSSIASTKHSKIKRLAAYILELGIPKGLFLLYSSQLKRGLIKIHLHGYSEPVFLRPGTSDIDVFYHTFILRQYDLSFLNFNPEVVIDVGAYTGLSPVFFAHLYPEHFSYFCDAKCLGEHTANMEIFTVHIKFFPNTFSTDLAEQ